MITFSPNDAAKGMSLTPSQMEAVWQVHNGLTVPYAPIYPDLEVVELETHGAIEVYVGNAFAVGQSYHRYYINKEGEFVGGPEYADVTCNDGEWNWEW